MWGNRPPSLSRGGHQRFASDSRRLPRLARVNDSRWPTDHILRIDVLGSNGNRQANGLHFPHRHELVPRLPLYPLPMAAAAMYLLVSRATALTAAHQVIRRPI